MQQLSIHQNSQILKEQLKENNKVFSIFRFIFHLSTMNFNANDRGISIHRALLKSSSLLPDFFLFLSDTFYADVTSH